jgi:hypothetical protein
VNFNGRAFPETAQIPLLWLDGRVESIRFRGFINLFHLQCPGENPKLAQTRHVFSGAVCMDFRME